MNKKRWIAAAVAVGIAAVAIFGVWYFIFRDDAPPAATIDSAAETLDSRSTSTTTGSGSSSAANGLDGTWTVDDSIGSFTDFSGSFAGFRVQEQLAGVGAKTAVGRTPDVTGGHDDRRHHDPDGELRGRHDHAHHRRRASRRRDPEPGDRDRTVPHGHLRAHEADRRSARSRPRARRSPSTQPATSRCTASPRR